MADGCAAVLVSTAPTNMFVQARAGKWIGTYAFALSAELLGDTDADRIPRDGTAERINSAGDRTAIRIFAAGLATARLGEAVSRLRASATSRWSLVALIDGDKEAEYIPPFGAAVRIDRAHERAAIF